MFISSLPGTELQLQSLSFLGSIENLAHSGCRCVFTAIPVSSQAAGPPSSGLLPLRPRGRPPYGLVPTSVCRLILSCVLPAASQASKAQAAPQAPPQPCRDPFVWGARCGGLGGLRRPRPGPPRGGSSPAQPRPFRAAGVLPGRAARHPNPDPSYPPRECLRPAADSPSPNGFPEPTAATTSFAASQNGRQPAQQLRVPEGEGRNGDVTGRGGASALRCLGNLPEVAGICGERTLSLCVRRLRTNPA